jgi:hypothetical protein
LPKLKIRERPPSMLRNVDGGPLGGAGAEDPGASTINAKKHRWLAPWEVPELKIRERTLSTLKNVDDEPPEGVRDEDSGASTINAKKHQRWTPVRCQN